MLEINPGLILWTIIVFILVIIVLRKFAWKPIIEVLVTRENNIAASLVATQKAKQEAEELIRKAQEFYSGTEQRCRAMDEKSRQDAEAVVRLTVEQTQNRVNVMVREAEQRIEQLAVATEEKFNKRAAAVIAEETDRALQNNKGEKHE